MRNLEKALYACSKNNDVDFSEFLGAVSSKDIEAQRKVSGNYFQFSPEFLQPFDNFRFKNSNRS